MSPGLAAPPSEPAPPSGAALRAELGEPAGARRLSSSPRSSVWQVRLPAGAAVVKQATGGPDAAERFAREVAALRVAARANPPVTPALLGVDTDALVLVLEQLPEEECGDDWMIGYAAALARLHATARPGDEAVLPPWAGPEPQDAAAFLALAAALGTPGPPGVAVELDRLLARLGSPLARPVLLHGDPCPANDLHGAGRVAFVDLEGASLGCGMTELAYLRIGFPTCWCLIAADQQMVERAENAYHAAWQSQTGTDVPGDLTDACAGWLLRGDALVERAHRGQADYLAALLDRDWKWGNATARQRLAHRLGVVAGLTADRADLAGLSRLCTQMRAAMLARWPGLTPVPDRRPHIGPP